MAKKLNSMPDFTAHLPKSVHDLSQSTTYTCTPGMLSPIYHDMLHTGDKIHFSASQFVRLNPLVTQPLGQIDIHLDYFFVPLSVLYTPAPSLFYQTDDLISSNFNNPLQPFNDTTTFPVFDFTGWLINCFMNDATGEQWQLQNSPCVFQDGTPALSLPSGTFDSFGRSVYRLFDFLDMNPESILDVLVGNADVPSNYPRYTPWFALAYQAIYQLYFRNDDREKKNYHYNIDKFYSASAISEDPRTHKSIFQINYCQRPKDYFNSVKVSPITSSISSLNPSVLSSVFSTVNQWISNSSSRSVNADGTVTSVKDSTQVRAYSNNSSSQTVALGAIRSMYMVEKLLRVIGRSEKNYESQFLAHFGVKIPHDSMHNITHIGHDMVTLTPDSVISQANTWDSATSTGSALGEIGGKGSVMLSGRKHSFEAPFHGVFMCISHIIPRRRYVLGLSKLHQLSKITDFWQPEFDKKGMQPLFLFEAVYNSFHYDTSVRVGWQFAYEQFKRKSDRVISGFVPTRDRSLVNTLAPWVIANRPYHSLSSSGTSSFGTVREDAAFFMVQPTELNVCMQVPYEPSWSNDIQGTNTQSHKPWLLYQRDPFICDFNMFIKKVNGMSEYGEPEL